MSETLKSLTRKPSSSPRRRARLDVDPQPRNAAADRKVKRQQATDRLAPLDAAAPKRTARAESTKSTRPRAGRLSALDAAARVLSELPAKDASAGISAPELIDRMKRARLWSSPAGKTPASTLYAAMIREINARGKDSRFRRVARGRFAPASAKGASSSKSAAPRSASSPNGSGRTSRRANAGGES